MKRDYEELATIINALNAASAYVSNDSLQIRVSSAIASQRLG
jgi:hypothetical protein